MLDEIFNHISQQVKEAKRPNIARTKTSQIGDDIINDLEKELIKQARLMKDRVLRKDFTVRTEFEPKIHSLISNAVFQSYITGLNYYNKTADIPHVFSSVDKNNIDNITKNTEDRFWNQIVQIEPVRESIFDVVVNFIKSFTSDLVMKALNTSTVSPLNDPQDPSVFGSIALIEFVTRRDFKVCPICEPLDGLVFKPDEFHPEIPDDTHPNCRCRYLIHKPDGLVVG